MNRNAWIETIDEPQAGAELRKAYAEVNASRGRVANILKVHSVQPRAMVTHLRLYRELMFGSSKLSRADRETIAVAVSAVNRCHY